MFKKLLLSLAAALVFSFFGCGGSQSDTAADGMAKHAADSAFQEAHAPPAAMDFKGKGEMFDFRTPDGGMAKAYLLKPAAGMGAGRFLFVIHEWWGLNDHVKQESERLFDSLGNVVVMALDLYDGKSTADKDEAGKLMGAVKPERCEAIIKGALAVAGKDGRVATTGWCFGGGWSLRSSILAAERGAGCVMYYGMPVEKAADLAPLKAEVLGIFAKKDGWINEEVVGKFEALAKATGKKVEVRWFDADHAFANPSAPAFHEPSAQEANKLALAFLRKKMG